MTAAFDPHQTAAALIADCRAKLASLTGNNPDEIIPALLLVLDVLRDLPPRAFEPELITVAECARRLKISKSAVSKRCSRGTLHKLPIPGGRPLVVVSGSFEG